ncbi:MAG: Clp protease N-terminal domain-containing protein [Chloroflexota bacterium]
MTELSIYLFGPPQIKVNGEVCEFQLKKSTAVFIYCVLHKIPVECTKLATLFWPDTPNAARQLNDTLYRIRQNLMRLGASKEAQNCLIRNGDLVQFEIDDYFCDLEAFEQATNFVSIEEINLEMLQQAINLYKQEFLGGFSVRNAGPEFEYWKANIQADLEQRYHRTLSMLSIRHMLRSDWTKANHYLIKQLAIEPEQLELYGLLMICHAMSDQMNSVDHVYEQYINVMNNHFGAAPQPVFIQLYDDIIRNQLSNVAIVDRLKELIAQNPSTNPRLIDALGTDNDLEEDSTYQLTIEHAQRIAAQSGFSVVGTPHLFLALIEESDSPFRESLIHTGNSPEKIIQTVRSVLGQANGYVGIPFNMKFTLEAENLLQEAENLAKVDRGRTVSAYHLWSSLLQRKHSVVIRILERDGVNTNQLQEIEERM